MEQVRVSRGVIVLYIWQPLLPKQKSGHCPRHRQTVVQHSELVETWDLEPNLLTAYTCQYGFMGTWPSHSLAQGMWPQQQKWVAVTEATWPVKLKDLVTAPLQRRLACSWLWVLTVVTLGLLWERVGPERNICSHMRMSTLTRCQWWRGGWEPRCEEVLYRHSPGSLSP